MLIVFVNFFLIQLLLEMKVRKVANFAKANFGFGHVPELGT